MSPRARGFAAAAVLATTAVLATAGVARAVPQPGVPADVAAAFAGDALRAAQSGGEGMDTDFSGARADDIHEVFWFSADFTAGRPTAVPVRSSGSWLASIKRGDVALGTLLVSKRAGGPAEWAGASADVPLGSVLGTLSPTEILVEDAPNGAHYALDGTTVRPLDDWARAAVAGPADLSTVQKIVAGQYARMRAQPAEPAGPRGDAVALVAAGVALAAAVALVVLARRRLL